MSNGQGSYPYCRRTLYAPKTTLCLALLAAIPANSRAFDVDYEIGVAAEYSDNINLGENDPTSDTVLSPQLHFEVDQDGPRVQMAARGDAQYLYYTGDTFDDELRGTFAGKLNWTVLPQRMDFAFQDYLSRQPVDQLEPFTPTNEQQANVFVTGPTLYARFNGTTRGQLDLRYTNSYAEENEAFNGDRYDVAARVLHELNPTQSVSANLDATKADFDDADPAGDAASSDYNAYDGYVGYTVNRRVIDADIDLGYSRLDPSSNSRASTSSALVRATLDWRISPRSLLTTTVRYQLTDATQALIAPTLDLDQRNFSDFGYLDVSVRPNPYRERLLRMRYRFTGERLTLRLVPHYRRIRYLDDLAESQDRRGGLVDIEYRLRPRLDLSVLLAKEDREYVDIVREDKDFAISVGLANRFTRHWTGRIDVQRRERDSSAVGRSYDENAVIVSLSYLR